MTAPMIFTLTAAAAAAAGLRFAVKTVRGRSIPLTLGYFHSIVTDTHLEQIGEKKKYIYIYRQRELENPDS